MNPPSPAQVPLLGYVLAASGAILFASKGVIIKIAYAEGLDALTLLALRMLLSAPVFLAVAVWSARRHPPAAARPLGLRAVAGALGAGLIGYWYASYADFRGLETLSPQFERLILFTYPLFVVLFGAAFFRQPVRAHALAAFAISYLGLALVFVTDFAEEGSAIAVGTAWVLSSAIAFALYQLIAKPMVVAMGPALFSALGMGGATLGVLVHFALTHPLGALAVSPDGLKAAVAVAVLATILPTYLMNAALTMISAAANATIGTLSPVFTLMLAAVVLGEAITPSDLAGTALVLAGVGLFTVLDRRRAA